MSCIAVSYDQTGVVIASDGVTYDYDDGRISGFASKVMSLPHRDAAIAWCGMSAFGHVLNLELVDKCSNFDEMVLFFPMLCKIAHAKTILLSGGPTLLLGRDNFVNSMSIALAGYSTARERYEVYWATSFERKATEKTPAYAPWELQLLPPNVVFCSANAKKEHMRTAGLLFDEGEVEAQERLNAAPATEWCERIICAVRLGSGMRSADDAGDTRDEPFAYCVGGFLQVTSVQRGLSQSWISHQWPDKRGEVVDPLAGPLLPAHLTTEEVTRSA